MKKELFGQIDFTHNNTNYYIDYEVEYVLNQYHPDNYLSFWTSEHWIENRLYWVVSDTDGTKISNKEVLLKAEKLLEKELDYLDIE